MFARVSEMKAELGIARTTLRDHGVRALFRKYGWRLVAAIVLYYIVRDVTLYILIPLLLHRHFGS